MPPVASFRRAAALTVLVALVPAAAAARVDLRETGSTLLYPVMNAWVAAFERTSPEISISTEASGSGAGVSAAENGDAALGTSDAFLDDAHLAQGLVNVPLAVSAQFVGYHLGDLAGETPLRLSGAVLAAIFDGTLTTWDDPRIAAINPELRAKLPKKTIVPIVRSDRSGDTFLFTAYLRSQTAAWRLGPATSIAWPDVRGEQRAKGNAGLLQLLGAIDGSITYVGITYLEQAHHAGIGAALLRNHAGRYVAPTNDAVLGAIAHAPAIARDGRLALIDLPGDATYPIVNLGYAIVKRQQPSGEVATSLKKFLSWVVDTSGGNAPSMLGPVHFAPLPDRVRTVARTLIGEIR